MGDFCRDKVTGFQGTVTAICNYMSRHTECFVVPMCTDKGELPKGEWIQHDRLETIPRPDANGLGFKG